MSHDASGALPGSRTLPILMIVFGPIVSLIAIVWIVVFYVSGARLPLPAIGAWSLLIGLAFWALGTAALVVGIVNLVRMNRAVRSQR